MKKVQKTAKKAPKKPKIYEKDIEKAILEALNFKGWMAWKNPTVGVFDSKKGSYRKPMGGFHLTGVSDIIAVKGGEVWFIEVKTPSGKMTKNQLDFEKRLLKHGGNYLVARKVEDLNAILNF